MEVLKAHQLDVLVHQVRLEDLQYMSMTQCIDQMRCSAVATFTKAQPSTLDRKRECLNVCPLSGGLALQVVRADGTHTDTCEANANKNLSHIFHQSQLYFQR